MFLQRTYEKKKSAVDKEQSDKAEKKALLNLNKISRLSI